MNPQARIRDVKSIEEISIREWETGLREAFALSRSESKVAAKAVHQVFSNQREADENAEMVEAINNLTNKLNSWKGN
jgi:hypothetical protein